MPNMSLKKVEMPVQDGEVRRNNFEEVALGYTKEMAMEEAQRCLHCPTKPCISGCPVAVNIPDFIERVKEGSFEEAYQSFMKLAHCLLFADVCVRRRSSVRQNVYVVLREKLWQSDVWSALWLTGTEKT